MVNATSERDDVLVELRAGQTLVDLPYPRTATAVAAEAADVTVVDGLEVLVAQGAASFELWTGLPAPVEVMRAAIRPLGGAPRHRGGPSGTATTTEASSRKTAGAESIGAGRPPWSCGTPMRPAPEHSPPSPSVAVNATL